MSSQTKESAQDHINKFGIFNKIEVLDCIDEWIQRIETGKYEISLCDRSKEILRAVMYKFRDEVLRTYIPCIQKKLMSYELFLDRDAIELDLVKWSEDTEFLGDDFTDYDGDIEYKTVVSHKIDFCTLDSWAAANGIKSGTARQWATRGRLFTIKNNGILMVSPIQYLPDAPFESDVKRTVRYKNVGAVPETITKKYPSFSGNILDLLFFPTKDGWNIFAISAPNEGTNATSYNFVVRDSEKKSIIRILTKTNKIAPTEDKWYTSPIGNVNMLGKNRVNIIKSISADVSDVFGKCEGNNVTCVSPKVSFVLRGEKDKGILCKASGYASERPHESKEYRLLSYIFGAGDPCSEARDYVQDNLYPGVNLRSIWNNKILYIETVTVGKAKEDEIVLFLTNLAKYAKNCILYDPTLVLVQAEEDEEGKLASLLIKAGYARVENPEKQGKGLYYAYNSSAISIPIFSERIDKKKKES